MNSRRDPDPVVVLNIGGDGRSGSTVLSALLGNHEGFFPVGECRNIWNALKDQELCGCGKPFSSCEFWCRVGERAFGGWDQVDVEALLVADSYFMRQMRVPTALIAFWRGAQSDDLAEYCRILGCLYGAIRDVSGCSVIVDSTKHPPYSLLLRSVPGLDLRFVHLLRDSRGVAYSENKKGIRLPEYAESGTAAWMERSGPWRSAVQWIVKNVAFSCVTPSTSRRVVTYESLMTEPVQELAADLRTCG